MPVRSGYRPGRIHSAPARNSDSTASNSSASGCRARSCSRVRRRMSTASGSIMASVSMSAAPRWRPGPAPARGWRAPPHGAPDVAVRAAPARRTPRTAECPARAPSRRYRRGRSAACSGARSRHGPGRGRRGRGAPQGAGRNRDTRARSGRRARGADPPGAHSGEIDRPFRWQVDHLFRRKSITCQSEATRDDIMRFGFPFRSTAGPAFAWSLLSVRACRHCGRDGRESRRRGSGHRRRHATCRREAGW